MKYFWNLLISIDQFVNTLFGGDPDETISSRMGRAIRKNECFLCKGICWFLSFFDKDHCAKSVEKDEGKDESF